MKAFIVVDMQNDFMPGGALGVPGAFDIIPLINRLIKHFPCALATQDWHPPNHASFALCHPGKKIGDQVMIESISQVLWPVHCVRGTFGSEFAKGIQSNAFEAIFYKGTDPTVDSYSAFFDNAHRKSTGLADYLRSRGVNEIYLAGVATDYCVLYSALDARKLGWEVNVIIDACRGIDLAKGDVDAAIAKMKQEGTKIITSAEVLKEEQ